MKATAKRSFMRDGKLIQAGESFECDKWEHAKWVAMGFVAPYETKMNATPQAEKKAAPKKKATKKKATGKKK